MNRLYLHIGTHKTATTSIQQFLASHRSQLRRQGLVYPDNTLGGFPEHHAHHRIAHAIAYRPEQGMRDARRFFDKLRRDLSSGEAAVISAEAMYRHVLPPAEGASGRAYNAGGRHTGDPLNYIRAVRECIGEFDVTVMVMLRRQDTFIESLYAEEVLSSGYVSGIGRFIGGRGWLADYHERLGMWGDVFGHGNLSVRVFEPKSFGMPVERYFVEWLGGTWDARFKVGTMHNVTVPRSLVEYKRAINHRQPRAVSAKYRRWLEALAAQAPDGSIPDLGRYYLTHDARAELMKGFEAGNRAVAEHYLGRSELFDMPDGLPTYDEPQQLSESEFRQITRLLLRSIAETPTDKQTPIDATR